MDKNFLSEIYSENKNKKTEKVLIEFAKNKKKSFLMNTTVKSLWKLSMKKILKKKDLKMLVKK